jgi:hypothetical protein
VVHEDEEIDKDDKDEILRPKLVLRPGIHGKPPFKIEKASGKTVGFTLFATRCEYVNSSFRAFSQEPRAQESMPI